MAVNYTSARFSAEDDNGRPLSGGRLYTYQNGTTTPAVTYKDAAGTTPNTNPIILDARGEAVVYLQASQVYTFILQNRFGSLVWSQDGISGSTSSIDFSEFQGDLAGSGGSQLIGFKQTGTGSVVITAQAKLYQMPVSPIDYGGVGNGTFDDTASWRAAAEVCRISGRALDVRGKDWKLTGPVDLSFIRTILADKPVLDARGVGTAADEYLLRVGDPTVDGNSGRSDRLCLFGQLALVCLDERAVPRRGIYLKGGQMCVDQLSASNYNGTGIHLASVWDSTFTRLITELCGNINSYSILGDADIEGNLNCLKISALQCEQAIDKGVFFNCIRSEIGNIHAERLRVTSTNDGSGALPNGTTYVSHRFLLGNSKVGQAIFQCLPAGVPVPVPGGGNTVSNKMNILLYADDSDINTWATGDAGSSVDIMVVGGARLRMANVGCNALYQTAPANTTTLENISAATLMKFGEGVTFMGLRCDRFDLFSNSRNINGSDLACRILEFSDNIRGNINISGLRADAVGDTRAAAAFYAQPTFTNATVQTYYGAFNARAVFISGLIATANLASQTAAEFRGVTFGTFQHNGNPSFITDAGCTAFVVTNWSKPTNFAWPRGTVTVRLGYLAGAAKHIENRDGALDWVALTTSP